jgi:hypothetical protein
VERNRINPSFGAGVPYTSVSTSIQTALLTFFAVVKNFRLKNRVFQHAYASKF